MLGAHAKRDGLAALQATAIHVSGQLLVLSSERDRHFAWFYRVDDTVDKVHARRADKARDEPRIRVVIQLERRASLRDAAEALGIGARVQQHDSVREGHRFDLI